MTAGDVLADAVRAADPSLAALIGIAVSPLVYHNCAETGPLDQALYAKGFDSFMGLPLVVVSELRGAVIIVFSDESVWKRFLQYTDQ
jgi:hypothetical protein